MSNAKNLAELAALDREKPPPWSFLWRNVVSYIFKWAFLSHKSHTFQGSCKNMETPYIRGVTTCGKKISCPSFVSKKTRIDSSQNVVFLKQRHFIARLVPYRIRLYGPQGPSQSVVTWFCPRSAEDPLRELIYSWENVHGAGRVKGKLKTSTNERNVKNYK